MSTAAPSVAGPGARAGRISPLRKRLDRVGDRMLFGVCALAALIAGATIVLVGFQIVHGASPALSKFGFGFVYETTWQPNFGEFGAGALLFGTAVTSAFALLLGAPIAIAIGLFLTLLAPRGVRGVVGPLVELLAAIPSVILGFWGLLVLAPFVQAHVEPFLHSTLGFLPIFGAPETTGLSVFTASLILTIMVIPIIASISRDLFQSVPPELQDGASALGATRWEVVRGIVLPTTSSGVVAACILGLGRALGEAIAVSQVIGAGSTIQASLFKSGDTLASRIALQFPGALTELHKASLYYCALILLVISVVANVAASWIGRRFSYSGAVNG
ncbi:MAG TPA: phosphate ABC transporter permease subunit PstC [Solirubrobacterales bacterium]|nr:phosphate ABC transporter permease subunit PstC [Solirubrobacterales bacterium]